MMPERLASKTIYESDWISLYEDKVKMPDGSIIDSYHRLQFPHESVCVVICNDKDEILMIQSRDISQDSLNGRFRGKDRRRGEPGGSSPERMYGGNRM